MELNGLSMGNQLIGNCHRFAVDCIDQSLMTLIRHRYNRYNFPTSLCLLFFGLKVHNVADLFINIAFFCLWKCLFILELVCTLVLPRYN